MAPVYLNPYDNPYEHEGINGSFSKQLFYVAGNSAVFSQILLVCFISAWCVVPVNWSMHYCFMQPLGIRSDMVFWFLFNLVFAGIFVAASGGLEGRNAFAWIKTYSVVGALMSLWFFKYVSIKKRGAPLTMLVHGFLLINIGEAVIWEVVVLGNRWDNWLNALAGLLNGGMVLVFSFVYGVQIVEYENGKVRQTRGNLSPMWIIAYTIWNIKYNCDYHAEKATYYIGTSLLVPFVGAFMAGHDWLETRGNLLLHAISLANVEFGGSNIVVASFGLFVHTAEDPILRGVLGVLSLATNILAVIESYQILKGRGVWMFKLPYELNMVEMGHPYVKQDGAVGPILMPSLARERPDENPNSGNKVEDLGLKNPVFVEEGGKE